MARKKGNSLTGDQTPPQPEIIRTPSPERAPPESGKKRNRPEEGLGVAQPIARQRQARRGWVVHGDEDYFDPIIEYGNGDCAQNMEKENIDGYVHMQNANNGGDVSESLNTETGVGGESIQAGNSDGGGFDEHVHVETRDICYHPRNINPHEMQHGVTGRFGNYFDDPDVNNLMYKILESDMGKTTQQHKAEVHVNVNEVASEDGQFHMNEARQNDNMEDDDMEDDAMEDEVLGDDEMDDGLTGSEVSEDDIVGEDDMHDNSSPFQEIVMYDNGLGRHGRTATTDDADMYGFDQDNVNAMLHSDDDYSGDDERAHRRYTDFKSPAVDQIPIFKLRMKFANKKEFRDAVTTYKTLTGRQVYVSHNEPHRLRVKCKGQSCEYSLYAKTIEALKSPDYVLVTMNPRHSETCIPKFEKNKISAKWVAERFIDRLSANIKTPVRQIRVYVDEQYKTDISRSKAYRARSLAKEKIEGNISDQYLCLWNYGEELKRTNPNTTVKIKFAPPAEQGKNPRFMRWYCCLGPLKKGFKEVGRPVIFVDGCFTRGLYKGQVLAALGVDPSNGFWPIAWAVVEKECKATWLWFFKKLMIDLDIAEDNSNGYTIMSDQQKGLGATITQLMSHAEKRYCVQHMYKNFKARHPGKEMKDKFWSIANSTTEESYNRKMEALRTEHPKVWTTIKKTAPKEQWVKAFFPLHTKCDTLVNNTYESFNAKIVDAREKHIIFMLETIRVYSMDRNRRRGEWGRKNNNIVTHAARNVLANNYKASATWKAITNGAGRYEVKGWSHQQFVVYPSKKTCTCRGWQLSGIPCCHAIVCILKLGENLVTYVDECYSQSAFNRMYNHVLQPINGMDMWPQSRKPRLDPPHNLKQTGRPPTIKRVEATETIDPDGTIRMKRHIISHCSNCGETGHNIRTCKLPRMSDMRHGFGVPRPVDEDDGNHVHQEEIAEAEQVNDAPTGETETANQPLQAPILRTGTRPRSGPSGSARGGRGTRGGRGNRGGRMPPSSERSPTDVEMSSNASRGGRGTRGGRGSRGGRMPKTYSDKVRENENAEYLGEVPPHRIGRWARKNVERVP